MALKKRIFVVMDPKDSEHIATVTTKSEAENTGMSGDLVGEYQLIRSGKILVKDNPEDGSIESISIKWKGEPEAKVKTKKVQKEDE